jgi:hypothetical protein
MTKPKISHADAIRYLEYDLRPLFGFLHRNYADAIRLEVEALKREQLLGIGESEKPKEV